MLFDPFGSSLNPKNTPKTLDQWAKGAYTHHTDESKGAGVIGVWDQSGQTPQSIQDHQAAVNKLPQEQRDAAKLDTVNVDMNREIILEDAAAWKELALKK